MPDSEFGSDCTACEPELILLGFYKCVKHEIWKNLVSVGKEGRETQGVYYQKNLKNGAPAGVLGSPALVFLCYNNHTLSETCPCTQAPIHAFDETWLALDYRQYAYDSELLICQLLGFL